nr:extracellular solute-binding protein [Actinomycetales bacterium]
MRTTRTLIAAVAIGAMTTLAACGGGGSDEAGSDTLTLWHYEGETSAMGIAWAEAMRIFEEEHEGVTIQFEEKSFEQIQQTAGMILNSDEAPDILEYNKGNATAGLLASQGLLLDISDAAEQRGWAELLPSSIATTARYDENGVMGSG